MLALGGICFVLAVLVYVQVRRALPLYLLWLAVAALYISFQGRFALMPAYDRPPKYDAIASAVFVMDIAAHVAVAVLCGVGWSDIVLLVLAYFCFGKLAGQLATGRALKDVLRILAEHEPDMNPEERVRVAHAVLEERRRGFLQSR